MGEPVPGSELILRDLGAHLHSFSAEEVEALIRPLSTPDPALYQILSTLNNQIGAITNTLIPLVVQSLVTTEATTTAPSAPLNFLAASIGTAIRLSWTPGVVASTFYEVRKGISVASIDLWITSDTGSDLDKWYDIADDEIFWVTMVISEDWDTASFQLRTSGLSAVIDPLIYGIHTFLVKAINASGIYSVDAAVLHFLVPQISDLTLTQQVIDNNILLYWSPPTTSIFNIKEYRLYKDSTLIGVTTATFKSFFELIAGTYIYSVIAVDIADNLGIETFTSAKINTPPDFALQASFVSALDGDKVNVILESGPKLLCCWETTNFEDHFLNNSWLSPRNQVDASYPIYIQPAALSGSYEEVIDYGTTIQNVIITVTYNSNIITPASDVTILIRIAVSTDGVTYSAFVNGASQFYSTFRYLKLRLEFTDADDKALIEVFNLTINLNVKREMDGGEVAALSTDASGTEVIFNKAFKDIESITCTVKSVTEPFTAIYDFTDVPDPVHFFVFAFDTTGNRVSKTVEWKARGII